MHDRTTKAKDPLAKKFEEHEVYATKKDIESSIPYEIKNNLVYDYSQKVHNDEN